MLESEVCFGDGALDLNPVKVRVSHEHFKWYWDLANEMAAGGAKGDRTIHLFDRGSFYLAPFDR
jgi:hypothetical protein